MNVSEHGLMKEMMIASNSTNVAHIVTEEWESACGRFEYNPDLIEETDDGRMYYGTLYHGPRGLIHESDEWAPGNKRLCSNCDACVPDEVQKEIFTDEKFEYVDGIAISFPKH